MTHKLNPQQQQAVEDNIKIARNLAKKYACKQALVAYDDLYSVALEAMCLAALSDPPPTDYPKYASMTVRCDLLNAIEKAKVRSKYRGQFMDADATSGQSRHQSPAIDLEDVKSAYEESVDQDFVAQDVQAYYSQCIARLDQYDRTIIELSMMGHTQEDIGTLLGVGRQVIKRRIAAVKEMFSEDERL